MNLPSWIFLRDRFLQYFRSFSGGACCWYTSNQDFHAIRLQDFFDTPPMRDLYRGDGGTELDAVKPEETMTEYKRVLGR